MSLRCILEHPSGASLYRGTLSSSLLHQNRCGMESDRPILVFSPAPIEKIKSPLPTLYALAAWTAAGRILFDWQAFRESLFDRLVRLHESVGMPPTLVVAPDLYTDYGGSQYIDSSFFGPHGSHIVNEVIPWVETHFPAVKNPAQRGVFGKSSGGYGALRLALDFPGSFAAVAAHSSDLGFEQVYRRSLVDLCSALAKYRGDVQAYRSNVLAAPKISGFDTHIFMLLGMAGFYSPNLTSAVGYDIPISWYDGQIDANVWQSWQANDPVTIIDKASAQEALAALSCLYIDCGNRDQYYVHLGARQLAQKLDRIELAHIYHEFDDNHSNISYRYDISLPLLAKVIAGEDHPEKSTWKNRGRFG